MIFTDNVLDEITRSIAVHPPERGGALLGPEHSSLITEFIFDPDARTSYTSYFPSEDLTDMVKEVEQGSSYLVFKGIVHSHPGLDRPSSQDLVAFGKGLDLNPHLPCFVAPIISAKMGELKSHELDLGEEMKMSLFVAWREVGKPRSFLCNSASTVRCVETDAGRMACSDLTRRLSHIFESHLGIPKGSSSIDRQKGMSINGAHFESYTVTADNQELMVMFPPGYPMSKPTLLITKLSDRGTNTQEIPFIWEAGSIPEQAINESLFDNLPTNINELT